MPTVFRWLVRLFLASLTMTVLVLFGVYYFASRSLPDYDAEIEVDGLSAPLEIVRDTANVPHILGATDADSFFGLGYVHAQDRLWQMTVMRRTAQGKLSEIFGTPTVRVDALMRRLDIGGVARSSVEVQSPGALAALEAYSAGVNARINQVNSQALGRGAPEFFLFPPKISPWQAEDSLAILKLMALQLTDHLPNEVLRARTSLALPTERVLDILPDAPGEGVIALPDYASLVPGLNRDLAFATPDALLNPDRFHPVPRPGKGGASNAWAAAPARVASGSTLLANDPHLELTAPAIWYLARVKLASGDIIGGTIPGLPLMLVGRSSLFGWGVTASYVDDQDVILERLDPAQTGNYLAPDGSTAFETRRSVVNVADAAPVTLTLRWSVNGPILTGSDFNLNVITPEGHVPALAWTGLDANDTSFSAVFAIMQAGSVPGAMAAGRDHISPAVNLILADRTRIGLQVIGKQPNRSVNHRSEGRLPTFGTERENLWSGYRPYSDNPRALSPVSGIVGNTNNRTVDRPFPGHLSHHWGDTQRIQRWGRLMQAREVHTRDSFIEAQLDIVSPAARTLLPLIARDLWFADEAAPSGTPERLRQDALRLLADWNGAMNEHLPEPLIYAAWIRHLNQLLIRDALGPLSSAFATPNPLFIERVFRNTNGASAWCDLSQSSRDESCPEIARRALDAALIELSESYGPAIASWRWGDAHQATHDHQALGALSWLGGVVNIRQSTSGGDHTLMRGQTSGDGPEPFLNTHAAGYRGVYDFNDPDSSLFVIATGQSGHPLSRHYDDLAEFWRRGEYVRMSLDTDLARAGATGITVLNPINLE
jgi:penicillin amidase